VRLCVFIFFGSLATTPALDSSKSWMPFSFSPGEKAGMRAGKTILAITPAFDTSKVSTNGKPATGNLTSYALIHP
jgi:hypothetical protein